MTVMDRKVKAVFFDVDGTLVSFNTHSVPDSTLESLKKLKEKGIKIFISTGRSPAWLDDIRKMIDIEFDGYVMINGQFCICDGEVIRTHPISVESIETVLPYIQENKISCEFVEEDYTFINLVSDRVLDVRKQLNVKSAMSPIEDMNRIYNKEIYQLLAYVSEVDEAEFLENMPGCEAVRWTDAFADIIPVGGGKDVGIRAVLEHYGFDKSECMAFGDGGNDIAMIKYVETGIAMGNAGENVKLEADFVTKSVDDHGIKYALERFNVI